MTRFSAATGVDGVVPLQRVNESSLTTLADRHGADKGMTGGDHGHPHRYTYVYESFFEPIRDRPVRLLEIGVYKGASLRMWEEYFPRARIVGIDIDPACSAYATRRSHVAIGDATDPTFVKALIDRYFDGEIDIVIDDGSHIIEEQIASLEVLFSHLSEDGLYFIEDICCSRFYLWRKGNCKFSDLIEYTSALAEQLTFFPQFHSTAYHSITDTRQLVPPPAHSYWNDNLFSVQYFHNMCVLIKRQRYFPAHANHPPLHASTPPAEATAPQFVLEHVERSTSHMAARLTETGQMADDANRRALLAEAEMRDVQRELASLRRSVSWRATRPFRGLGDAVRSWTAPASGRRLAREDSALQRLLLGLAFRHRRVAKTLRKRSLSKYFTKASLLKLDAVWLLYSSPFFDRDWYRQQYLNNHDKHRNPIIDYIDSLHQGDRRAHPAFDDALYLKCNPGVKLAIKAGHFVSGFHHFILCGQHELKHSFARRFPVSLNGHLYDFDETAYLADNPDISAQISRGLYRSGCEHFMLAGYKEIAEGKRHFYSHDRRVDVDKTVEGTGSQPNAKMLCAFAHYDPHSVIDDYVLVYLKALRREGIDIIFVTPVQDETEIAKVSPLCVCILIKTDAGRDFGSWYLALKELEEPELSRYERFIFANDSVYFPVRNPGDMFLTMAKLGFNYWGITDSRDTGQYHIQSYFLVMDKKAQSIILPEFLRRYEQNVYLTKWGQIQEFEIGLTGFAREHGLQVGAYCSIDTVRDRVLRSRELSAWRDVLRLGVEHINPTHDLWDLLVSRFACPALKLELLRDNPKQAPELEVWPQLIDEACLKPKVIRSHLKRLRLPRRVVELRDAKAEVRLSRTGDVDIKEQIAGRGFTDAPRVILYAHFDPQGIIDDHVISSLSALGECGNDIIFVTPTQDSRQLDRVRPHSAVAIVKQSSGSDFGSWYLALRGHLDRIKQYDSVIWMNDSVYFPLFDPRELFESMETRNLDFWGVVDSYHVNWHICSWFWAFRQKIIGDGWLERFMSEYNPCFLKWDIIWNYEHRIPLQLKQSGYDVGSYVAADDLYEWLISLPKTHQNFCFRKDFNMTHDFWDMIIERYRCPALKVDLLRDNPLGLDIAGVLELIAAETPYDVGLIAAHLGRIRGANRYRSTAIAATAS